MAEQGVESSVQSAHGSLQKTSNIDWTITGYAGIEAIFDRSGVVFDCI